MGIENIFRKIYAYLMEVSDQDKWGKYTRLISILVVGIISTIFMFLLWLSQFSFMCLSPEYCH